MVDCVTGAALAAATPTVMPSHSWHRLPFWLPVLAALASGPSLAQDFTVPSGPPVGQQTMNNIGDRGVIEVGGTVTSNALYVVEMLAADQMVENYGVIEASGNTARAIFSSGDRATITNFGTILATGNSGFGIHSSGANSTLVNAGTISTLGYGMYSSQANTRLFNSGIISSTGDTDYGMSSFGPGASLSNSGYISTTGVSSYGMHSQGIDTTLTNSGTITTTGSTGFAMYSQGYNATLTNSGTITTTGDFGYGMRSAGHLATVANSGTISTAGDFAFGIWSVGTDTTISNSGTITTADPFAYGILAGGINATVTNSGKIIAERADAILFGQDNAVLNLLAGTAIDGTIMFSGVGNTVSFGPGLNALMTFSVLPDTILSANPHAVSGATVAVLDRGGFVLTDNMALTLAGDLAGIVDRGSRGQCLTAPGGNDGCAAAAWLAGFGSFGARPGSPGLAGSGYLGAGGLAGLEFMPGGGIDGGIFLGAVAMHGTVGGSHDATQRGGVVGGHAGVTRDGYFAEFYAALGMVQTDSQRTVADNTVAGGLALASASHAGYFISPAVTVGAEFETGAGALTPSLRLRYAGLMLDGYSESGNADAVVVDDRLVHELEMRAQLALALTPHLTEHGTLSVVLRAGADAFHRQADTITGTLLGQPIAFNPGDSGTGYRGFAAFDLDLALSGGTSLFGNVEMGLDTFGSYSAAAHAGISGAF